MLFLIIDFRLSSSRKNLSWAFQISLTIMGVVPGKFLTIDVHLWKILAKDCHYRERFLPKN